MSRDCEGKPKNILGFHFSQQCFANAWLEGEDFRPYRPNLSDKMSDPFCPPLKYTYDSIKLRTAFEDSFRGCAPFSDVYFEVHGANNGVDPMQVNKSELVTASSLVSQLACRSPQITAATPNMTVYCPEQSINIAQVSLTVASWILLAIVVHLNAKYRFASRAFSCLLRCCRSFPTRSRDHYDVEVAPASPVVTHSAIVLPPDEVTAAEAPKLGAIRRTAPLVECRPCRRAREARNFESTYEETMPAAELRPNNPNHSAASFPSNNQDSIIGNTHPDGSVDSTPLEDAATGRKKVSRLTGLLVLD